MSTIENIPDHQTKILAYYIGIWQNLDEIDDYDKSNLSVLYSWLVKYKPSMEQIATNPNYNSIIYYLNMFNNNSNDELNIIQNSELENIKLTLIDYHYIMMS